MILLVNGAPRSGKDTFAGLVYRNSRNFMIEKFASALKDITHRIYGLNDIEHDHYESCKDKPHRDFMGETPRNAYIHVSEDVIKPNFGDQWLGTLLARRIAGVPSNFVIPDSGFVGEVMPLIDLVGPHNIMLININRIGCTFNNDSRSRIMLPGIHTIDVANDGTISELEQQAVDIIKRI